MNNEDPEHEFGDEMARMGWHVDDPVACTAEEVVAYRSLDAQRDAARRRRLNFVLHDLGLIDIVGKYWAHLEIGDGLFFERLDPRAADRLIRRLEQIAQGVPDTCGCPGPGQLRFGE